MRARTSSLRFVSWVPVAESACGHCRRRAVFSAWNSAIDVPNRLGSPPTSFSEMSRLKR